MHSDAMALARLPHHLSLPLGSYRSHSVFCIIIFHCIVFVLFLNRQQFHQSGLRLASAALVVAHSEPLLTSLGRFIQRG
jgi:hypothetical protein